MTTARFPAGFNDMQMPPPPDIQPKSDVINRLANVPDAKLMARWQAIIRIVREELTYLNHQRQVMQSATDVYNGNPWLLQHNGRRFFDYIRQWYGGAMATGYRRQTDPDPGSASLRVLLEEMLVRPDTYSIDTLRPYCGAAEDQTIRDFVMRVADADVTGKVDVEIIKTDIQDLISSGRTVKKFVNKVLAHTDIEFKQGDTSGPTFNEIHGAQAECERIARRWIAALGGPSRSFNVVDQFDWLEIFDRPWRFRRPGESDKVKRFLVSTERILDEELTDAFFDGDSEEKRNAYRAELLLEVVEKADKLDVNESIAAEMVAPAMISVERIL